MAKAHRTSIRWVREIVNMSYYCEEWSQSLSLSDIASSIEL